MKLNKVILAALLSFFIMQGCRKTDTITQRDETAHPVKDISKSSGLRLSSIGDYGDYQVIGAENNNFAQIANLSTANGAQVILTGYKDEPHQKWRITYVGSNNYKIMNMGSGKFLESYNYNGAQVLVQANERELDEQLWALSVISGNVYKAENKGSGLAITSNGNGILKLEEYTGKTTQQWGYNALPASSYRDDEVSRFFQRSDGTQAWDGNHSLMLSYGANKGKVIWITNDEFYNQLDASGKFKCYGSTLQFFHKNNAAMLQPASLSWNPALTHNIFVTSNGTQYGEEVFHDFFGKVLWPTGVIEIKDKIIVSLVQVTGLNIDDEKIGIIDQDDNTSTVITVPGYSGQRDIEYSVGFFKDGGYAYIYGKDKSFNPNLYVARFALDKPMVWTFWNGSEWAATPIASPAARVLSGLPSGGISVNKVNGKYLVVSHDFGFFCNGGRNFYSWTSPLPNGAFGNKKNIFKRTDYKQGVLPVFYTPVIHPQFDNGKNELLITYCTNFYGPCMEPCSNGVTGEDPDGYRPKAFRVPYSIMGL